ncbi:transglycosylase family protein [Streptomyces sp. NPDC059985]|uniref:transglycosylase family protein n=1 Tax=Streptomyces sp. NPDC059985 TaxID=3347025 RepID=UPI00369E51B6
MIASVVLPLAMASPAHAATAGTWDRVAACESSSNWKVETNNGFSGGLQFTASTWKAFGGTKFAARPSQASREQQISVAERVLSAQGPNAWPVCSKKAGLH